MRAQKDGKMLPGKKVRSKALHSQYGDDLLYAPAFDCGMVKSVHGHAAQGISLIPEQFEALASAAAAISAAVEAKEYSYCAQLGSKCVRLACERIRACTLGGFCSWLHRHRRTRVTRSIGMQLHVSVRFPCRLAA